MEVGRGKEVLAQRPWISLLQVSRRKWDGMDVTRMSERAQVPLLSN